METTVLDIKSLDVDQDESCKAYWYFMPDNLKTTAADCTRSMDVIEFIRHGMPYYTVDNILDKTCISRRDISNILHISVRQMNRYHPEDLLSAEQSGFIYEFSRLYVRGLDIFGDKETFEKWVQRPQMALGMQVPVSLLDTAEGFRMVNDLLSQIEYGFYS
jgi:putative toxin-antitoxin system antitoxin component (TIGR02293 family)